MTVQRFMLDLEGLVLTEEEYEIIEHPLVGGIIFFARNYKNTEQLSQLIQEIRSVTKKNLLLAVDQEGGRVQRFKDDFTPLVAPAVLGKYYQKNKNEALSRANLHGWLMAAELRSVDIDFSFAPVLDLDYGVSSVIGDRSFHHDEKVIIALTQAYIKGMRSCGMASTAKHFPGHGAITEDSHKTIPVDRRSRDAIWKKDIQPFIALINNQLDAVMPAHVTYSEVDDKPAGFSRIWLQDILRNQLRFQGVIFSDDLTMEGASVVGGFVERAEAAIDSGCDMFLACNNRQGAIEILDNISLKSDNAIAERLSRMKGKPFMSRGELLKSSLWKEGVDSAKKLREFAAT